MPRRPCRCRRPAARQTFFNHFAAKQDVVFAWIGGRRHEVGAGLAAAAGEDALTRLLHGLRTVAALYDADAATSRALVQCWIGCGGRLTGKADATADLFREVISAGQESGQVRDDLDPATAARMLLDVYLGRLYVWATGIGTLWHQVEPAVALALDAFRPVRHAPSGP